MGFKPFPSVGSVRIQGEEIIRAPQRQHDLADGITDAVRRNDKVASPQDRRAHKEPAHGVRTVFIENTVDIRIITQMLAHFLPVIAKHYAMADHIFECRAVKQCCCHNVEGIEPSAGLPDIFHNIVPGEMLLKIFTVFKRIVELGKRHGP